VKSQEFRCVSKIPIEFLREAAEENSRGVQGKSRRVLESRTAIQLGDKPMEINAEAREAQRKKQQAEKAAAIPHSAEPIISQKACSARDDAPRNVMLAGGAMCEDGGMARASGEEALDGVDGGDAATRADCRAVQRGRGTGKVELLLQRPALQKRVDEASVKQVASASRVDCFHMKRWRVVELGAIPGEHAVGAESGGGEAAAEAAMNGGEGFLQISCGCELAGNVAAGDEVVDVLQERFDAGIKFVEVGDDGNAG